MVPSTTFSTAEHCIDKKKKLSTLHSVDSMMEHTPPSCPVLAAFPLVGAKMNQFFTKRVTLLESSAVAMF